MRKIRDILRLHFECQLSPNQIGRACQTSRASADRCIKRFARSGMSWPLPESITDTALEEALSPPRHSCSNFPEPKGPLPDWESIRHEMTRKGVTLQLLWEEWRQTHPNGPSYSRFCRHYAVYKKSLTLSFRQDHKGGEKGFVDYSGVSLPVVNRFTGEVLKTEFFVFTWGASNLTYFEFTLHQNTANFIGSHVRALSYFGCAPRIIVPDNLKAAVQRPDRYEADLNFNYGRFAEHYGLCILPARVGRPKDKAKVECHVLIAQRWVLARLRNRMFFSLEELNAAARELLEVFNAKFMKRLGKSRRELFEELDRPFALPLPIEPYALAEWKASVRLQSDYHFEVDGNFYSAPYTLRGKLLHLKLTEKMVEAYHGLDRVACHVRLEGQGEKKTEALHMPKNHRHFTEWNSERVLEWAAKKGPQILALSEAIIQSRRHAKHAFGSIMGILRLEKVFGRERLERACQRALIFRQLSYRDVRHILERNLDAHSLPGEVKAKRPSLPWHENIRGGDYYTFHKQEGGSP